MISSGNEDRKFEIDPNTGALTLQHQLDFESKTMYGLNITVSDNGTPPMSTITYAQIDVDDVNDNTPIFEKDSYEFTIVESESREILVGRVLASDVDSKKNGYIHFRMGTIIEGDSNLMVTEDGAILTIFKVDRENTARYIFGIQAVDSGFPSLTSLTRVTVSIADVNDNAPVFGKSEYIVNMDENSPIGTIVTRISAEDKDLGRHAEVAYRFSSLEEYPANLFQINSDTGVITVDGVIDREKESAISLEVQANDSGVPPLAASVYVKIDINDLNDNRPVFTPEFYSTIISLNDTSGLVVTFGVAVSLLLILIGLLFYKMVSMKREGPAVEGTGRAI